MPIQSLLLNILLFRKTELTEKLNQLQRDYETLQRNHSELETAKAAQEEQFNRIHEEDLLKLDSLKGELTEKVTFMDAEKTAIQAEKNSTLQQLLFLQEESNRTTSDFISLQRDLKNVIEQKDHELEHLRNTHEKLEEKYRVRWLVLGECGS